MKLVDIELRRLEFSVDGYYREGWLETEVPDFLDSPDFFSGSLCGACAEGDGREEVRWKM